MVRVKNKLKEKIIVLIWDTHKVEYTMKELAEAIDIPLTTFYRYLKEANKHEK